MHHSIAPRTRKKARTVAGVVGPGRRHVSSHSDGGRAWKRVLIYVRLLGEGWTTRTVARVLQINDVLGDDGDSSAREKGSLVRGLKSRFRAWLTTPRSRHPRKTSRHFDARYSQYVSLFHPFPRFHPWCFAIWQTVKEGEIPSLVRHAL